MMVLFDYSYKNALRSDVAHKIIMVLNNGI